MLLLVLAQANPEKYVELGRTRVLGGEIGWSSPALDQGRLFVRNRSRAVCLFVGSQDRLSKAMLNASIKASDVPQGEVYDFSKLLGVEPEYAMAPPTASWLWRWYLAGTTILAASAAISAGTKVIFTRWMNEGRTFIAFTFVAFTLGSVAGTPASIMLQDFIFTWPVCLFVAFAAVMSQASTRRPVEAASSRRTQFSRWVILFFLVTCAVYIIACRQLSLVTELAFLCSFPAAVPCLLLARLPLTPFSTSNQWPRLIQSFAAGQLAFAAYFAATVWLLSMRYGLQVSMG